MHRDEQREGGRPRPGEAERFEAAAEIAASGAAAFKRYARRYSLCAADAEDAYQRGLEILLTKAPTADRPQLRAWLHTVVKHEALAVRRQRERALGGFDEPPAGLGEAPGHAPEECAGRRERTRLAAEALAHLKPAEVRCMLLKALGYSYEEISVRTGFSRTKVNRCLTEGRRRFFDRMEQVRAGAGCAEFEPLLSALADGERPGREEHRLRAHLDACAGCRATLRSHRSAPTRLAEALPPALLLPVLDRGGWWSRLSDWLGAGVGERVGALAHKVQGGVEALGAKQAAAVVASTAAVAGGGVAVQEQVVPGEGARPPAAARPAGTNAPAEGGSAPAVTVAPGQQTTTIAATTARTAGSATPRSEGEFGFERAESQAQAGGSLPGADESGARAAADVTPPGNGSGSVDAAGPATDSRGTAPAATAPGASGSVGASGSAGGTGAGEFGP